MSGLLRKRDQKRDADNRRHSYFLSSEPMEPTILEPRASEQISRKASASNLLSPTDANVAAPTPAPTKSEVAVQRGMRPLSPPIQEANAKTRRFSMLKFRHASDSQLSTRARQQQQQQEQLADAPPMPPPPPPPEIVTTAPTFDLTQNELTQNELTKTPSKKKSRMRIGRAKVQTDTTPTISADENEQPAMFDKKSRRKTMSETSPSGKDSRVTFDEPERPVTQAANCPPPAYGDEGSSALALPVTRLSESSRSDGSAEHGVYAQTTTTTHTVSTTTTFFRLSRRKKPAPLFPLPQKTNGEHLSPPRASTNFISSNLNSLSDAPPVPPLPRPVSVSGGDDLQPTSQSALAQQLMSFVAVPGSAIPGAGPGGQALLRNESSASARSSPTRQKLGMRSRSSTINSLQNVQSEDTLQTPTLPSASTRTSTSTGRKSFGDLFSLSARLRQNSEPAFARAGSGPATPGSNASKRNSLVKQERIIMPERFEDDTPAKYLVRLEEAVSRGVVASVLSKGTDPFSQAVLRSYMRGFGFFGEPMDMAIRKLLMEVELPKETQQIDRCLQSFADRYHECNPGIYASPENAYFIAFSLLILHTDVFNKNNKHKMQKADYLKNTRDEGVFDEILECFYDNISYTPFIHVEDDIDINGERIVQHKTKKKSILAIGAAEPIKRSSREPVDPYTLIIDGKLHTLRPNLKDVMHLDEHYSYLGTAKALDLKDLQKTFFKTGVLQIVSARSRPDAFMSEKTVTNPNDAHPGIVDIKITKVGLLWRKDPKKKKTRSPWQEWGAILTGAQLYFFRNTTWIKSLMNQLKSHHEQGHDGTPVIFKPPLESFKPDALMSTDDAVALLDSTYKKHKHAFVFVRHGGFEETFLADNEDEMNDWLAKLNYAAAFRTSGVRMRGVVGGNHEGQRSRGIRQTDSANNGSESVQSPAGEVAIASGKIDNKMAQDILAARREIMMHKISEAEEKLATMQKQLDSQLTNARHLDILAPIQQKTREQVILAAGRMAAKLKWLRMEIWRLRCHKDILTMDLEEERAHTELINRSEATMSPQSGDKASLSRLESKASTTMSPRSHRSRSASTLTKPQLDQPTEETHDGIPDDVFSTPPSLEHTTSYNKSQTSWELPPFSFDAHSAHRSTSSAGPKSPSLIRSSRESLRPPVTSETAKAPPSPGGDVDAAEKAVLEEAGILEGTSDSKVHDAEHEDDKDRTESNDKEKFDRSKIRRSLHRTLREAHVPTHHRSKKGRDSASSIGMAEERVSEDILSRGTGSFTVHGKKASIVHFGSEIQAMSPEERFRMKKLAQKDETGMISPGQIEGEFTSALAEPVEWHRRSGSAASNSTTTARSFKELHKRLEAAVSNQRPTSSGTVSDEAFSTAESMEPLSPRQTSVSEVKSIDSNPDKQPVFYTPETNRSPVDPDGKKQFQEHEGKARPESQTLGTLGLSLGLA